MSKPKRHHYLPQFYLNGFCNTENGLWVYNDKNQDFKNLTPINTAVQTDYYTTIDEEGNKNIELEKILSQIEGQTKPIIDKLHRKEPITDYEKEVIALFVALFQARTPGAENQTINMTQPIMNWAVKQYMNNEKFLDKLISDTEKEKGEKCNCKDEVKKALKEYPPEMSLTKVGLLQLMFGNVVKLANYYTQMDWQIFFAPKELSFITSDNPFVVYEPKMDTSPYGYGVLTPSVEKIIPLSSKILLWMGDKGKRFFYSEIPNKKVLRYINASIFVRRKQFVISRDKDLLKYLFKRTKNAKREINLKIN